eukprot:g3339.t1
MAKQNENPIVYGDGAQGSDTDGGILGKTELPLFLSSKSLARAFNSGDANELSMLDESSDVHPEDTDNSVGNDDNDDNSDDEPFTAEEIFELIRNINDPEHPLTLEQLKVVQMENIHVNDAGNLIDLTFTPTIPHCSMSTLIGLSITVKLIRSLPRRFKINVKITPGTHAQEHDVNKQLNDKERVSAALENPHLLKVVNECLIEKSSRSS